MARIFVTYGTRIPQPRTARKHKKLPEMKNPLLSKIEPELRAAGISANVVSERHDAQSLGNAVVELDADPLLLRFIRDRSQEMLDIAASRYATEFFQFDDIAVTYGWAKLDDVLGRRDVQPIEDVIRLLGENFAGLKSAFRDDVGQFRSAAKERAFRQGFLPLDEPRN